VARRLTGVDGLLWAAAAAVLGAVVYLSLGPPGGPSPFALADKVKHLVAYVVLTLAFLLAAAWRPGLREPPSRSVVLAVVGGAVALGILLELLQAVDPFATRQADVLDGVADAIGVGLGLLAWAALRRPATRAASTDVS
jgi:VanZ family protein